MHFALPPRKTSHPLPYARASPASSGVRRRRTPFQLLGYVVLALLTVGVVARIVFSDRGGSDASAGAIEGPQDVVLVTMFDNYNMSNEYMGMVRTNREDYAARHGYKTYFANASDYANLVELSPVSWAVIPTLRQALSVYPRSTWFWSLSADALIMNPSLSLESHIFTNLESLMQKDVPVVPPDSVIHTFSHLRPKKTHLILSRDMDNLAHDSLLLKNTPYTPQTTDNWATFFLDAWFDPLYRAYSFQQAENHALEHIIQWHPTILAKLAIIEQRQFNSYNYAAAPQRNPITGVKRVHDSMWQAGDFVVNLKGCRDVDSPRDCDQEMREYFAKWEKEVQRMGGTNAVPGGGTIRPGPAFGQ